jgi:hypothetical protein
MGVRLGPRDILLDTLEQIAATCDRRARAMSGAPSGAPAGAA